MIRSQGMEASAAMTFSLHLMPVCVVALMRRVDVIF